MTAYVVDPTNPATPTNQNFAKQGAEEFRALKGYVGSLVGFPNGFNIFRRNAIINGAFDIWQRGNSFPAIASFAYFADRTQYIKSGAMVHTISRSTNVPTVAEAGRLFNYSTQIDTTTVDAAIGATDFCLISQKIEGYNWVALAQRPLVLSFWVKSTKAGIYTIGLRNSGSDRYFIAEYTINSVGVWEKKVISIPASPSAGTWNYTNGIGLNIFINLAAGTDFHGTPNSWQTGAFFSTVNQVNGVDSGHQHVFTGFQLEASGSVTPFEDRSIQEELNLCYRYYEKSFSIDIAPAQNTGVGDAARASSPVTGATPIFGAFQITYQARKRLTNPTIVTYNPSAANSQVRNVIDAADCSGTATSGEDRTLSIACTGNAACTPGDSLAVHWSSDAEF